MTPPVDTRKLLVGEINLTEKPLINRLNLKAISHFLDENLTRIPFTDKEGEAFEIRIETRQEFEVSVQDS